MDNFAIFSYSFEDAPQVGDIFADRQVQVPTFSENHCRAVLNELFGSEKSTFNIKKYMRSDADDYPCTVLAHNGPYVLLRLEHPKYEKIYEKRKSAQGGVDPIDMRLVPSNPFLYVVIDCREGCGNKIAISIDTNAWRKTDTVAALIEDNINRKLESLSRGFRIRVKPEVMQMDYVSHSRNLIKKKHLTVEKMTISLTRGTIDPLIEEIIRKDKFISGLMQRLYKAHYATLNLYGPDGEEIVRRAKTFEHLVMLVASNPVAEPFRLSMKYSDGSIYSCGKDVRMEFRMDELTFMDLCGKGSLFPELGVEAWFNMIEKQIREQRDAIAKEQDRATKAARALRYRGAETSTTAGVQ